MTIRTHGFFLWIAALSAPLSLTSCLPTVDVDVSTPEPIKVDLSMDVHVYQHGKAGEKTSEEQASYRAAMDARRDRMQEIQELKNNRFIGENREGKVEIRNKPAGEYGDYVAKTVREENLDREFLMRHESEEKGVSVGQIREAQWRHWQRKSFPGEWIEVEDPDGSGYFWQQKEAAGQ